MSSSEILCRTSLRLPLDGARPAWGLDSCTRRPCTWRCQTLPAPWHRRFPLRVQPARFGSTRLQPIIGSSDSSSIKHSWPSSPPLAPSARLRLGPFPNLSGDRALAPLLDAARPPRTRVNCAALLASTRAQAKCRQATKPQGANVLRKMEATKKQMNMCRSISLWSFTCVQVLFLYLM